MPGSIETITDSSRFEKLFYDFFLNGEVYLKTSSGNFRIHFQGYSDSKAALKIALIKKMPSLCVIMCRIPGETIYVQLQYLEKQEEEIYLFHPMKVQIISAARSEARKETSSSSQSGKKLLFVTNVISDSIIERTLALEPRKTELIKQTVLNQLDNVFQLKKMFFLNEGLSDIRMKYFYDKNPDYIIPDFAELKAHNPEYKSYNEKIFSKDYYLANRKQLVSESAVSVRYRGVIPFGFLQVNHTVALNETVLSMLQKLARQASQLFYKSNIFKPLGENLLISDVSSGGLGIVFKERSYIRYFSENSYVFFELVLPDQVRLPMLTVVRSITFLENKIIKVGCEIVTIDENARKVYLHYINQL